MAGERRGEKGASSDRDAEKHKEVSGIRKGAGTHQKPPRAPSSSSSERKEEEANEERFMGAGMAEDILLLRDDDDDDDSGGRRRGSLLRGCRAVLLSRCSSSPRGLCSLANLSPSS